MTHQPIRALQNGLKEWACVIDALGSGKQTFLIRTHPPVLKEFILYPTFSYFSSKLNNQDWFDAHFQPESCEFARASILTATSRAREKSLVDLRYFATVDQVIEIADKAVYEKLAPMSIWSLQHIHKYLEQTNKSSFVWLLRVSRFSKPSSVVFAHRGGSPNSYRHPYPLPLAGSAPVIGNPFFAKTKKEILGLICQPDGDKTE